MLSSYKIINVIKSESQLRYSNIGKEIRNTLLRLSKPDFVTCIAEIYAFICGTCR